MSYAKPVRDSFLSHVALERLRQSVAGVGCGGKGGAGGRRCGDGMGEGSSQARDPDMILAGSDSFVKPPTRNLTPLTPPSASRTHAGSRRTANIVLAFERPYPLRRIVLQQDALPIGAWMRPIATWKRRSVHLGRCDGDESDGLRVWLPVATRTEQW